MMCVCMWATSAESDITASSYQFVCRGCASTEGSIRNVVTKLYAFSQDCLFVQ
jgi:hypothetical protein